MKLKYFIFAFTAMLSCFAVSVNAQNVAKVGDTEYATLEEAFAAVQAGETLTILAGDFTQNLDVQKAITVAGETDAGGNNLVNFAGKLNITADGATVKNINVNNSGSSAGYINAKNVTVDGCKVVGGNGFRNCYTKGTVTFKNSVITGSTYGIHFDGSANGNIVIDNCTITGWTSFASTITKVTMKDTRFDKGNYNYVRFYQGAELTGCSFNEEMNVDLAVDGVEVTVADCTVDGDRTVEDLFDGKDIANSSITIDDVKLARIAKIGDEYYANFEEAFAAVQAGETLTLLADLNLSDILTINKAITFDGNGKTLTSSGERAINVSGAEANGVTIKNLTINASGERAINVIKNATNVTVDNVTATAANYTVNVATSAPNAVVAIKNSTLNGLCTVNVSAAGSQVTVDNSTVNCNDNNTTAGESYAALSLNKEAVGGSIVATNSTINVTEGSDSMKGRNGAENGTVTINGSTDDVAVMVAVITYPNSNAYHAFATLKAAIEFAKEGDTITLIRDVTMDYNARDAYETQAQNVVIDGNGKTLTLNQKNSDWASIGLANNSKLVLNNMTIEKTGYGDTSGAWNTHAIIFTCPVEMNDVTVNNSIAVQAGATLNNVDIVEANGYYGLWINGNGQTVEVNGGSITATNGGRGIKIADQYVDAPAQVTLSVTGTVFETAQKAAVLVSSKAGANITASDVDITNVAADNVNFVWVDEDWAEYFSEVEVTGATVSVESADSFAAAITVDGAVKGYYKTLAEALDAAADGETVTLIWSEGNDPVAMNGAVFGKNVTITGTAKVDWNKGFLFVGRGGVGNATVTFDGANLTSASNNASYGIHVSGREKNTDNKYDGTLVIKNSTIELDYLINKGAMTLDKATLTVKNGFATGGRPAGETESGQDATATMALTNGSKLVVNNHNGMGLGYEAIGVMDVDATSTFETTQSFLVTAKGTMNIAGKATVAGTLTNNGAIVLTDVAATLTSSECGNVTTNVADYMVEYADGAYKLVAKKYVASIDENRKFESFAEALNAVQDDETITLVEGAEGDESKTEIEFTKDIEFTITGKAPKYALPVITFQNATVNIKDAHILIPELDARQNAEINVINSTVDDAGGNSIAKSYYNGAINIDKTSTVYMMQVTTMGYINIEGTLNATWQTNVYGNGMITMTNGATFNTAALQLTGKDYSGRDNTDAERVGMPATIVVDGSNLTVGKVLSNNGADYSYNSSYGINIGTIDGKNAVLDIKKDANVNFFMADGETANIGTGGTVNIDGALSVTCRKEGGNVTLVNNGAINLTAEGATLKAQEGLTVTTTLPGYFVQYADGVYSVCGEIAFVDGELTEYTNATDVAIKTLTYKRSNIKNTWTPFYVPFAVPVSALADKFDVAYINDVRRTDSDNNGELDKFSMEIILIHCESKGVDGSSKTLKANYPYFIRSKSGETVTMEITLTDATLYAAKENVYDCTTMTEKFEIKGNYHQILAEELDSKNDYVVGGGEWHHLETGKDYSLNPFRFYMTRSSRDGSDPTTMAPMKSMKIVVCGEEDENGATIIYDVVEDSLNNNGNDYIYDLQGRRVSEPKKGGIYIKNGKKILF